MDDVWGAEKHNPLGFKRTAPDLEDDGCLRSWTSFFLPGLVSKVSNKKTKDTDKPPKQFNGPKKDLEIG